MTGNVTRLAGPSWWDVTNMVGTTWLWGDFKLPDGRTLQLRTTKVGDWQPGKLFHVRAQDRSGKVYDLAGRCPSGDPGRGMRMPVEYTVRTS